MYTHIMCMHLHTYLNRCLHTHVCVYIYIHTMGVEDIHVIAQRELATLIGGF